MTNLRCPLCYTYMDQKCFNRLSLSSDNYYDCSRCGKFILNDLVYTKYDIENDSILKASISYWVRKKQTKNSYPRLTVNIVQEIMSTVKLPDISEQINNLIYYLGNNTSLGKNITIRINDIVALMGSQDTESLLYIFDELNKLDLIKVIRPDVKKATLMNRDVKMLTCLLTVSGWGKYNNLVSNVNINKDFKFKKHKITEDEKLWLSELLKNDMEYAEARSLKVLLRGKISSSFDPSNIDKRLINENRLTLLGLWYLDNENRLIFLTHQVIESIKDIIEKNSKLDTIDGKTISEKNNISLKDVKVIFRFLFELRIVYGIGSDFNSIMFSHDATGFDKILTYKNIEDSLEDFYLRYEPHNIEPSTITANYAKGSTKGNFSSDKEIWNEIQKEYGINKSIFGKKINFINNSFKRAAIIRDVGHSYSLSKYGFSKSSVILAGSVIEEILRLYLESKNIKSDNTFDAYIKVCAENKLFEKGFNLLNDSTRHFRNLIHMAREKSKKDSITPSMAKGAVSAIFTLINNF